MIWKVFAHGNEAMQLVAVKLFGQIEGPAASNALATLAVFNDSAEVRRQAPRPCSRRDPRDVVGRLINLINRPFKYKVQPGNGPGSSGVLLVDGETFDIRRLYRFPAYDARLAPVTAGLFGPAIDVYAELRCSGISRKPAGGAAACKWPGYPRRLSRASVATAGPRT